MALPLAAGGWVEEGAGGVVADELFGVGIEGEVGVEVLGDGAEGEDLGEFGADAEGGVGGALAHGGVDKGGEVVVLGVGDSFEWGGVFVLVVF